MVSLVGAGVFPQGKIAAVGPSFETARDRKLGFWLAAKANEPRLLHHEIHQFHGDFRLECAAGFGYHSHAPPGTASLLQVRVLVLTPAALVSRS
jgi:hypothetical protein